MVNNSLPSHSSSSYFSAASGSQSPPDVEISMVDLGANTPSSRRSGPLASVSSRVLTAVTPAVERSAPRRPGAISMRSAAFFTISAIGSFSAGLFVNRIRTNTDPNNTSIHKGPLEQEMSRYTNNCRDTQEQGYDVYHNDGFRPLTHTQNVNLKLLANDSNPMCVELKETSAYGKFEQTLEIPKFEHRLLFCLDQLTPELIDRLRDDIKASSQSFLVAGKAEVNEMVDLYDRLQRTRPSEYTSPAEDFTNFFAQPPEEAASPSAKVECSLILSLDRYFESLKDVVRSVDTPILIALAEQVHDTSESLTQTEDYDVIESISAKDFVNNTSDGASFRATQKTSDGASFQATHEAAVDSDVQSRVQSISEDSILAARVRSISVDVLEALKLLDQPKLLAADTHKIIEALGLFAELLLEDDGELLKRLEMHDDMSSFLHVFEGLKTCHLIVAGALKDRERLLSENRDDISLQNHDNTPWEQAVAADCGSIDVSKWVYALNPLAGYSPPEYQLEYVLAQAQEFASQGLVELGVKMTERAISTSADRLGLSALSGASSAKLMQVVIDATGPKGLISQLWMNPEVAQVPEGRLSLSTPEPDLQPGLTTRPNLYRYMNTFTSPAQSLVSIAATRSILHQISLRTGHETTALFKLLPRTLQTTIQGSLEASARSYRPAGSTARSQWLVKVGQDFGLQLKSPSDQKLHFSKKGEGEFISLTLGMDKVEINSTNAHAGEMTAGFMKDLWLKSPEFRQAFFEGRMHHHLGDEDEVVPYKIDILPMEGINGEVSLSDEVQGLRLNPNIFNFSDHDSSKVLVHEFVHSVQPGSVRLGYESIVQPTLGRFPSRGHDRAQALMMGRLLTDIGLRLPGELVDYTNDAFSCAVASRYETELRSLLAAIDNGDISNGVHLLQNFENALVNIANVNPERAEVGSFAPLNNRMSAKEALMQHVLIVILSHEIATGTPSSQALATAKTLFLNAADSKLAHAEARSAWQAVIGNALD